MGSNSIAIELSTNGKKQNHSYIHSYVHEYIHKLQVLSIHKYVHKKN